MRVWERCLNLSNREERGASRKQGCVDQVQGCSSPVLDYRLLLEDNRIGGNDCGGGCNH